MGRRGTVINDQSAGRWFESTTLIQRAVVQRIERLKHGIQNTCLKYGAELDTVIAFGAGDLGSNPSGASKLDNITLML